MSKSHNNILDEIFPDMIFIQDTIFARDEALFQFAKLKPSWDFLLQMSLESLVFY